MPTTPIGTRERLAFELPLYTGLCRGDAVRVGRQHGRDGEISIRAAQPSSNSLKPTFGRGAATPDKLVVDC